MAPDAAQAYHFCGHIYTTGSCPNPLGLPRIDRLGFPIRPHDGRPIDNLGRSIDDHGRPIDEAGNLLRGPDGDPLAIAPRTRLCQDWVPELYPVRHPVIDGSWYRCCGGTIRKLVDCCAYTKKRVNGDAALTGHCYRGRKVFCVMYYQTSVPC